MINFKMNFSKAYTDLILKYADRYKPFKYNTKYSNKYYLEHIFNVLGDVVTWKSLMNIKTIISNHEYHYKTISKIHLEWARNKVYENAYTEYIRINKCCDITQDNFIDGTLIINKSGIENIGYGCGESLKKKFTSLTAVCNDNTKPISIICNPNYTKITKKNRIIKTLPHDSKSILPSIDQINNNYENKNIKYNLGGDKGFVFDITKVPCNVNLIAVKRKNQIAQNTDEETLILKKRYKIENLFAKIKVFNRVHIRRDKLIASYMGFVYLALMKII